MDDFDTTATAPGSDGEGSVWLQAGAGSLVLAVAAFAVAWWLGAIGVLVGAIGIRQCLSDPDRDGIGLPVLGAVLSATAFGMGLLVG